MRSISKADLIAGVTRRYKRNCLQGGVWLTHPNLDRKKVYEKLKALPPGATEEQITAIIGNGNWTKNQCDECGNNVDIVILLGEDRREELLGICMKCLQLGQALGVAVQSLGRKRKRDVVSG